MPLIKLFWSKKKDSFLFFAICLFMQSHLALGASIIYLNTNPPYFVANKGTDAKYHEGAEVCVFDPDGTQILCAPIVLAKPTRAAITVDPSYLDKLELGMQVLKATTVAARKKSVESLEEKKRKLIEEQMQEKEPDWPKRYSLELGYLLSAYLPYSYTMIEMDSEAEVSRSGNYWKQDQAIVNSLLGAEISFHFPIYASIRITPNFVYRYVSPISIDTDGRSTDLGSYVTSEIKFSGIAVNLDSYWEIMTDENWWLYIGPGVGYEMSTISFSATRTSSSGSKEEVGSAVSKLNVPTARINARFDYNLDSVSMGTSLHLLLPISASQKFSSSLNVFETIDTDRDLDKDVKEALAHKKSGFGADLAIFVSYNF